MNFYITGLVCLNILMIYYTRGEVVQLILKLFCCNNCSLIDASEADAASSVSQHLRRVWVCPTCQETMIVNMAEELSHRGECELLKSKGMSGRGGGDVSGTSLGIILWNNYYNHYL